MEEAEAGKPEKPQPNQTWGPKRRAPEEQPEAKPSSKLRRSARAANWLLDMGLFLAVFVAGVFVCKLLWEGLISQQGVYRNAIDIANKHKQDELIINYARALDFATVKLSALLLGFILAFLGALYVLRNETSMFRASFKAKETTGAFQSSSPGLVILTLGVLAVICTLFSKSYLSNEYSVGGRAISAGTNGTAISATSAASDNRGVGVMHDSQPSTASGAKKYALSKVLRVDGTQDTLLLPGCKEGNLTSSSLVLLDEEIERLKANRSQNLLIDAKVDSMPAEIATAERDECSLAAQSYIISNLNEDTRRVLVESQGKERPYIH